MHRYTDTKGNAKVMCQKLCQSQETEASLDLFLKKFTYYCSNVFTVHVDNILL